MQTTAWTFESAAGKRHLLPMPALVTVLRCVGRIDFDKHPAGASSLVGKFVEKPRPSRVRNALCETVIVDHPVDGQIFNTDGAVTINNAPGMPMGEIITPESNALMNTSNNFAPLLSLRRAFFSLAQFALSLGKGLFVLPEKLGWVNGLAVGKRGKGAQADIDAYGFVVGSKPVRFNIATERNVPLASRRTSNGSGLGVSAHFAVQNDFDVSDLGDSQTPVFDGTSRRHLRKCKRVVPAFATKTRIARLFTRFYAAEESLVSKIDSDSNILQNLGMHTIQAVTLLLENWNRNRLRMVVQRFLALFPRSFSLFKQMVVKPTAFVKRAFEGFCLIAGRKQSVFKGFKHMVLQ